MQWLKPKRRSGSLVSACRLLFFWLGTSAVISHAIEHGSQVSAGAWPEVVALVDRGTKGAGIFGSELKGVFCSGTVIRPRIVLTAAHCVTQRGSEQARTDLPTQVSIYRGEGRQNYRGPVQGQVQITQALIHPESAAGVDLALLLIAQPLDGVEPLSLQYAPTVANQDIVSVGFGEANPQEQRNTMGQKSAAGRRLDLPDEKEICSRRAGVKTPSSAGDSGGPALLRSGEGRPQVLGVLTGFRTKHERGRQVEADCWIPLSAHREWLAKSITALESRPTPGRP